MSNAFQYNCDSVSEALGEALSQTADLLSDVTPSDEMIGSLMERIVPVISLLCIYVTITPVVSDDSALKIGFQEDDIINLCDLVDLFEPEGRFNAKYRDAYDLLCLFDPTSREKYKTLFPPMESVPLNGVRDTFFDLALDTVIWLLQNDYTEAGLVALSNLMVLVKDRTEDCVYMRYDLMTALFVQAVDYCPEWVYLQCVNTKGSFEKAGDANLAQRSDFFWALGIACMNTLRVEEAEDAFKKCFSLRYQCCGPTEWATWLPLSRYAYLRTLRLGSTDDARILEKIIHKIDANAFPGIALDMRLAVIGQSLFAILTYYNDYTQDLVQYHSLIERFSKICDYFNDRAGFPILKKRVAENLYSCYYIQKGELLQAEQHLLVALQLPASDEKIPVLPDYLLECNYLNLCWMMNDLEHGTPYASSLRRKLEQEKFHEDDSFYYRGWANLLCFEVQNASDPKIRNGILSQVQEKFLLLLNHWKNDTFNLPVLTRRQAIFMYIAFAQILVNSRQFEIISNEIVADIYQTVKGIYSATVHNTSDRHLSFASYTLILTCALRLHAPDGLHYAQEFEPCWNGYLSAGFINTPSYITGLVFMRCGEQEQAIRCFQNCFSDISVRWQSATKYLNDSRLIEYLETAQDSVTLCYASICDKISLTQRYQIVLQYKALAALAGHERNRILSSSSLNHTLLSEIRTLQDRIITLEKESAFNEVSKQLAEAQHHLAFLEAKAAEAIPQNSEFTEISIERVAAAMPNGSAVLEYYLRPATDTPDSNNQDLTLDLFILKKYSNTVSLSICEQKAFNTYAEAIDRFMELVGIGSTYVDVVLSEELKALNTKLYNLFFAQAVQLLNGVTRLYIAPDVLLFDFPYTLLGAENSKLIGDVYSTVQIISGRELLFDSQGHTTGSQSLVLGDPLFDVCPEPDISIGGPDISDSRAATLLFPLPFSGLEAKRVAQLCDTIPLLGRDAAKHALLSAKNLQILHLATHGSFDAAYGAPVLYKACLYLAGSGDFMRTGIGDTVLGDGILTADEISRLDLHSVQIAVLSTCCSGRTGNRMDCIQGLVAAFSAAGVKYVVTCLWEANDLATTLLMDFFYNARKSGADCPSALQYAKERLRNCTVNDLRGASWLQSTNNPLILRYMDGILSRRGTMKPFAAPYFWGGFVCHQCRS